jgi:uncharacterized protein
MNTTTKNYLSFFGFPIAIILVGSIIVSLFYKVVSNYTFIPGVLVYWMLIFIVVYYDCKKRNIGLTSYIKGTKAKIYLIILSLLIGCLPLPIFIFYFKNLNTAFLITTWAIVAIVNPFFEEVFWRGYMLEHKAKMPMFFKATYATTLFTLSHLFIWGVFSTAMHSKELLISVFIMGFVWSFIYIKSKSIVLPYFSHMLVDIFNLSTLAMLNMLPIAFPH